MKAVILNGSPRKKWNTDLMLREGKGDSRHIQKP